MTEDLFNKLQPWRQLMRTIVINSSCSNVPIAFRELVLSTMKTRGISLCNCNSGVLNATSRLYQEMLKYEANKGSEIEVRQTAQATQGGAGASGVKVGRRKNSRADKGE